MLDDHYETPDGQAPVERIARGGLLVEIYDGLWAAPGFSRDGQKGRWSRLIDETTGEMLLQTSHILDSEWSAPDDGSLLLRLRSDTGRIKREEMFRIEPGARAWRDLGDAEPWRPIPLLAEAVIDAWQRARSNQYERGPEEHVHGVKGIERFYSPLGTVRCEQIDWEIVHSWGLIPRVYLTETNEKIFDLGEWGEPATFTFEGENVLRIRLGNPERTLIVVHPHLRTAQLAGGGEMLNLAEIEQRMAAGEFPPLQ